MTKLNELSILPGTLACNKYAWSASQPPACLALVPIKKCYLQLVPVSEGPNQLRLQWTAALDSHRLHDERTECLQ